jgi:HlyD family secretion protein
MSILQKDQENGYRGSVYMKRKLKWVIIGAIVLAVGIAVFSTANRGVEAEILQLSKGEIVQYLEDTAEVKSSNVQTVYIEGQGKIIDIKVDEGDQVNEGDILAVLDKTDLELQLKDAQAKIDAIKAELKGTEIVNYANEIELAKIAVEKAQITFNSSARDFENAEKLYKSKVLSETEYIKAEEAYKLAQSNLNLARLELEELRKGTPFHVKEGYEAQLEQAVIYKDTIQEKLKNQDICAPVTGVVLEILIEKNMPAFPSTAAFVIGSTDDLELEAEILADDANKIKIGNEVEISGKPVGDMVLKGEVIKIAPIAKTVTSSLGVNQKRVPVTIEMQDSKGLIRPGYDLDVKIITVVKNGVIKVPDSSVFDYMGDSHVFIVDNGKAALRAVKKGIESGDFIEINEGLNEGDTILVKPGNDIKEGVRIKSIR